MPSIIQTPLNTFTTPAAPVCTTTADTVFSPLCATISSFSLPSKRSLSTPKSRPISLPFSNPSRHRLSTVASSTTTTTTTTCPHLSEPKKLKPEFPIDSPLDSESTVSQVSIDELFNSLCLAKKGSDFELVRATHALFLKLHDDTSLGNAVISAYLKMGLIVDAYRVFMCLSNPNVVSFTSLISSFAKANRESDAIELFFKMRCLGIEPNEYSFVAILTVCIRTLDVELGMQLHCLVVKLGYLDSVFVVNALMGMYANCGCFDNVVKLLEKMNQRDVASWNTVLSSLIKEGLNEQALDLFRDLSKENGIVADQITLSTLLTACIGCNALAEGKEVHSYAFRVGLQKSLNLGNAFVKFYTKCGSLKNVVDVFEMMPVRDVVTWTELIVAYMEFGFVDLAIEAFKKMPERNSVSCNAMMAGFCRNGEALKVLSMFFRMIREGMPLDEFALTSVVTACGLLMEPEICKQIHAFVIKFGIGFNACVEAALLDMYTRCRMMIAADLMFHSWPSGVDNSVIQTSMLCAYARNGQTEHAISLFHHSQLEGNIVVDEVVVSSVLGVCGTLGFHEMGSQIHTLAIKKGFEYDVGVGNSLISMYSKCCNIDDAVKVFNKLLVKDTVSWNCLISGHILHRQGDKALAIWLRMKKEGVKPDTTTFVLVISAYRHTSLNLIDECRNLFLSLKTAYSIDPTSEHYATYVGVLGSWGFLEEAEEVISNMPFEAEVSIWKALLDSCRLHFNTGIGKRVAKHILAMEPQDPSSYVLVSNLYSASGRWHCSEMMRDKMRERGLHKHPCRSWIIHDKKVHSFYTRDRSHPQTKDIYSALDILVLECLKAGYVPDMSYVLHEVEEHQKKDFLFYHSAKLAATYGLLMSRHRKPIRVVKNVVLCGDCHTFLKYVSEVSGREIVFRDASGFHCFANGQCSCKDYW